MGVFNLFRNLMRSRIKSAMREGDPPPWGRRRGLLTPLTPPILNWCKVAIVILLTIYCHSVDSVLFKRDSSDS